tara:strand:- start:46 stop:459 length:414 start_codon:yes stop_codon:yes gene_type:complete
MSFNQNQNQNQSVPFTLSYVLCNEDIDGKETYETCDGSFTTLDEVKNDIQRCLMTGEATGDVDTSQLMKIEIWINRPNGDCAYERPVTFVDVNGELEFHPEQMGEFDFIDNCGEITRCKTQEEKEKAVSHISCMMDC